MLVLLLGAIVLTVILWRFRNQKGNESSNKEVLDSNAGSVWDLPVSEEDLLKFVEVGIREQDYEMYTAYQRMIALMHSTDFRKMEYRTDSSSNRGSELRRLLKSILCATFDSTRTLTSLNGFVQQINGQNNLIQVCNYLRILSESNLLDELVRDVNKEEFRQVKEVFENFHHTIEVIGQDTDNQSGGHRLNKKHNFADDLTA